MSNPGWTTFSVDLLCGEKGEGPMTFDICAYVKHAGDGELEAVLDDDTIPMTVSWEGSSVALEVFLGLLGSSEHKIHEASYETVMDACRSAQDVKPGWYCDPGLDNDGTQHHPSQVCRVFGYAKLGDEATWLLVTSQPIPSFAAVNMSVEEARLFGLDRQLHLEDPHEFTNSFRRFKHRPESGLLLEADVYYVVTNDPHPLGMFAKLNEEIGETVK